MPKPPNVRAARTSERPSACRPLHVLVLAAVALPLIALVPVATGSPDTGRADGVVAPTPGRMTEPAPDAGVSAVHHVTVVDGADVLVAVTDADTVEGALATLGIERGELDLVEPALHAPLGERPVITIRRVEIVEEQVELEIPRSVVRTEDPRLVRGVVRVERRGEVGLLRETHEVVLVAGEEDSRTIVASEVVREPVDRIERIGTRVLSGDAVWDELARCEAGGRWDAVREIGGRIAYAGGLQFSPRTWRAFKPSGFPEEPQVATREQQIVVGERVLARQGWGAWPSCSRRLGLR